jgi:hypothetical protein
MAMALARVEPHYRHHQQVTQELSLPALELLRLPRQVYLRFLLLVVVAAVAEPILLTVQVALVVAAVRGQNFLEQFI